MTQDLGENHFLYEFFVTFNTSSFAWHRNKAEHTQAGEKEKEKVADPSRVQIWR